MLWRGVRYLFIIIKSALPGDDAVSSNLESIRETYDALTQGDIERVLVTFADKITWAESEGGPHGGTYHDPDEVVESVFGPLIKE